MPWSKRYRKVLFKLRLRHVRRHPHIYASIAMALVVSFVGIAASVDAYLGRDRYGESAFTTWKKVQEKITGRSIASAQQEQCHFDQVTLESLQREISLLEGEYQTGHHISGNWKGIELQKLPSIQAQFIADFGHLIGDQNKSQSFMQCKEVICVMNTIYLDYTKLSGYLSYYWYLKTGSMLSMSNVLPGQQSKYPGHYNGETHNYRDYLFSRRELINFYKLAKSLPEQFLHNPLLKSIHKVPNNNPVGELLKGKECAVSKPTGQILINNYCMDTYKGKNAFYINVANQMAKYIDKHKGQLDKTSSLSSSKKWLEYGLWQKEEYF
jgi:hypothetical protein